MRQWLKLAAVAALVSLPPELALGNDRDLRAKPIPAASCVATGRGTDGTQIGGDFAAGAYVVTGNFPESAGRPVDQRIQCGLPVNNIELSNPSSNDNDITSFQVVYRDADGRETETLVEVTLNQTQPLASGALQSRVICRWSSNVNGTAATSYVRANVPCAHDIPPGAFYHFTVRLFTTATGATTTFAGFAGITFP